MGKVLIRKLLNITKSIKWNELLLIPIGLFLSLSSYAQITEFPVSRDFGNNFRIKSDSTPINIPIWDDFSGSNTVLDTAFWVQNNAIFINSGIGKNAPSLNVATLDGWDAKGKPYSQDSKATGSADSLTSRPILLDEVPFSKRNSVFLSFFYQFEGNGDKPNPADSLILEFKKGDGTWTTVWPLPGENLIKQPNVFNQKYVQVTDEYFTNDFQFKFTSFGRLSGPFDTWNLDYIYLDKNRSASDGVNYLDRAFRDIPSSIIGPYTAMPKVHFFKFPGIYLDSAAVAFTNLEANVQPVEFSVLVEDQITKTVVDVLIQDSAFLSLRYPLGNRVLKAGYLDVSKLDDSQDSIYLRTRFVMDTGDKFLIDSVYNNGMDTVFTQIDLRVNDTTSVETVLADYYAYDDGTAEFGAGINQLNGRLALQFIPAGPGIIKSIDINFQNIGKLVTGTPITIFVLRDLDRTNFSLLGSVSAVVQVPENLNDFVNYEFGKTIVVLDTFYIGYQQTSNDFIAVGLDKNTDTGDRIFYNISGVWAPNLTVKGSLMMHPRYTDELVTGIHNEMTHQISVYPNPTNGVIHLSGNPIEIKLYNIQGMEIPVELNANSIDISRYPPSVYFLMIRTMQNWEHHKVIKY